MNEEKKERDWKYEAFFFKYELGLNGLIG